MRVLRRHGARLSARSPRSSGATRNPDAGAGRAAALGLGLLLALAAAAPLQAAPSPASPFCDSDSVLTPIGLDTAAGRVLLSLSGGDGQARWILVLDSGADSVRAYTDSPAGRYSGSVGAGPVISVAPCAGAAQKAKSDGSCLQPLRFRDGAWEPLGAPLTAPADATVAATYDHTGAPWLVLLQNVNEVGTMLVTAYRLEGTAWKLNGARKVIGVGEPAALPARAAEAKAGGITTGFGLFVTGADPRLWLEGVPALPLDRRGPLLPLPPNGGACLAADGNLYYTNDHGESWRRSTWTPWGDTGTVGVWRVGSDFTLDLPFGTFDDGLRLVWFDRRNPKEEKVYLTRRSAAGSWETLAELPAVVKSKNGDSLPLTHVLSPGGARWEVLFGCAATAGGSGLVVRTFDGKELSASRFLPIRP